MVWGYGRNENTFRMSGTMLLGPREENGATTGAEESLIVSLFNISASGCLMTQKERHKLDLPMQIWLSKVLKTDIITAYI